MRERERRKGDKERGNERGREIFSEEFREGKYTQKKVIDDKKYREIRR